MVCIIEKNYQAELEEYSRLFGGGQKGYDTAYTLLCMNNGYTLDKAPTITLKILVTGPKKQYLAQIITESQCYLEKLLPEILKVYS